MYSPSVLIDMMRPDGSSTIPVLNGEPLSADLAHELMGIQVKTVFTIIKLTCATAGSLEIPNN